MGRGGWGQSLAWKRDAWVAALMGSWRGGGYSGLQPAPLSLSLGKTGVYPWGAAILTGDILPPGSYLRLDLNQGWWAEKRVRVGHTLRLPWSRAGMASDMGYQLRLDAAL